MANRSFRSDEKSARGAKKNHHGDIWFMAAVTRSSDELVAASRLPEVGVTGTKKFHKATVVLKHF